MKKIIFKGSGVAIVTPFTNDGINYKSLDKLIDFHLQNSTDAIIVCGTTGEASTMTLEEKKSVIKFTVDKVNRKNTCNCWYWWKLYQRCNLFF